MRPFQIWSINLPGSRDYHGGRLGKRPDLIAHRHAAEYGNAVDVEKFSVLPRGLSYLVGQFAGGCQDQYAQAGLGLGQFGRQPVKRGQDESSGLAGTGLCRRYEIASREYFGNGLFLNGSGSVVTALLKCFENRWS